MSTTRITFMSGSLAAALPATAMLTIVVSSSLNSISVTLTDGSDAAGSTTKLGTGSEHGVDAVPQRVGRLAGHRDVNDRAERRRQLEVELDERRALLLRHRRERRGRVDDGARAYDEQHIARAEHLNRRARRLPLVGRQALGEECDVG
eukprot:CAMPEP_0203893082 /NCGR_PEP_ID=MMETSP0359-20131031/36200_1 /ASSEMBLY_ACC=CAM_ASM_000338 /TAXON_ID=268821 /ORGANISM="Scrippsiella Hangoei, Strain SHTV-5" /LENGTH=147 /DNA_ID=CAMNT_0050815171 /DNA_START=121 /DNA_END=561 /DNA_ORIENTATION=+